MSRAATRSLVAVLLLLLCAPGRAAGQPLLGVDRGQDPTAGSRVFGAKGCVKCHAINGLGGTIGPDLGRIARPRSLYDVGAAMWNHLPNMLDRMQQLGIERPRLDPEDVGDLVAFLFTVDYFDPPGDPQAGRRLFTEKQCILCHQVAGVGGVVGPNLDALRSFGSPIFVAAAMWNHGPAMAKAMRARRIPRPAFSDRELLDLIAYVRSASPGPQAEAPLQVLPGRADEGRRLFSTKRCIECHGAPGQGGRVGPDLAERSRGRSLTQFAAAMWNKQPAMTAAMAARGMTVPQLTAEEMADVVAYLYSVRYFAGGGDAARGRTVLARSGCLACHAVGGRGGRIAADLARLEGLDSPQSVFAALWNHAVVVRDRGERRAASRPKLTTDEMADVVAFFATPAGRR